MISARAMDFSVNCSVSAFKEECFPMAGADGGGSCFFGENCTNNKLEFTV